MGAALPVCLGFSRRRRRLLQRENTLLVSVSLPPNPFTSRDPFPLAAASKGPLA